MKTYTIQAVYGGFMLTGYGLVANRIVSAGHLFNTANEAKVYGERFYA